MRSIVREADAAPVRAVEARGCAANFAQGQFICPEHFNSRAPTRSATAREWRNSVESFFPTACTSGKIPPLFAIHYYLFTVLLWRTFASARQTGKTVMFCPFAHLAPPSGAVRCRRTAHSGVSTFCIIPGANLQIRRDSPAFRAREAPRGAAFPRRRGGESRLFLHFETAICSTLSKMYFAA